MLLLPGNAVIYRFFMLSMILRYFSYFYEYLNIFSNNLFCELILLTRRLKSMKPCLFGCLVIANVIFLVLWLDKLLLFGSPIWLNVLWVLWSHWKQSFGPSNCFNWNINLKMLNLMKRNIRYDHKKNIDNLSDSDLKGDRFAMEIYVIIRDR